MIFNKSHPEQEEKHSKSADPKQNGGVLYNLRCIIEQKYEVPEVLRRRGFGKIYGTRSPQVEAILALMDLKDELLADSETRELFRKKANDRVSLSNHPYIVRAFFVEGKENC